MTEVQRFQLNDNPGGRPLKFVANRHRFTAFPDGKEDGIVLVLLHGLGFNKETWDPFLEDLAAAETKAGRTPTIKEAWTYDVPNHGESARLNEQLLFDDRRDLLLEEYARCGQRLLRSGHIQDMDKHRVILVGHSVGTAAVIWLCSLYHTDDHKTLAGCLLIEPPSELFHTPPFQDLKGAILIEPTKARKDIWPSKEEARAWFKKRIPWKNWDARVLDTYIEHGLRELPSLWYPDPEQKGVTLSLPRHQEIFAYDNYPELNVVASCFPGVRKLMPVHVFVSEQSFLSPDEDECKDLVKKGFSLSMLPEGSDHLVVHEMPTQLAKCVLDVLDRLPRTVQGTVPAARL